MATPVHVPRVNNNDDEVKLVELKVEIGSPVTAGQVLAAVETDKAKRQAYIAEATKIHQDDIGHLPLHQQGLAWGVSKKVDLVQLADNFMFFKWMTVK